MMSADQTELTDAAAREPAVRLVPDVASGRPSRSVARIGAVIPTRNEAANLPHVFARLPLEELFEVIIVDGHSSDDTVEVARQLLPSVRVVLADDIGKGYALGCGFAAARSDIIVMLDGDGSTDPAEIPAFLDALFAGADFVKGSRFMAGGGSTDITRLRRLGNRFFTAAVNLLFRKTYTDLCYGYNAFWSDVLPALGIGCSGFEIETLTHIRVAKAGLTVTEVPSVEYERIHGVSHLRPLRDGLRVMRTILSEWLPSSRASRALKPPSFNEVERRARDDGPPTGVVERRANPGRAIPG
jgi:glycosyltransferase involved in cell wall biosynthesis